MGILLLGIYLICIGLIALAGLSIPAWAMGLFALIVGIVLIGERYWRR